MRIWGEKEISRILVVGRVWDQIVRRSSVGRKGKRVNFGSGTSPVDVAGSEVERFTKREVRITSVR